MNLKHLVTPAKYKHAKANHGKRWNGYESRGDRAKALARIRRELGTQTSRCALTLGNRKEQGNEHRH